MEEAAEALTAIQTETAIFWDYEERLLAEIEGTLHLNMALTQHQALSTQCNLLQLLQDGDRNYKFFHTMYRIRKTSTGLSSLLIDDALSFDSEAISDRVVNFFSEIFTNQDHDKYDDSILDTFIQPVLDPATPGNIQRLEHVLSAYGRLSGQLYNPAKFKVYFGSAVTSHVRNAMRRATGITEGSLPFTYLEVPIFRGAPRTSYLAALADSIIASLVHSMMVYYWPRSLLKRIETAMRNFLWSGDISKKNNSCSISWAHCCSPLEEGGLGIRSLRIANDSFMCKLAWDILCNKLANFTLIHDRYLTSRGKPRSYSRVSSIWPGNDNWLGYIISEKIGIPADFVAMLTSTIGDYFHDEQWYFDYDFFMMHTDGVKDILRVHVSRDTDDRVWGSSVSGQLTSRMAYDFVFPFREWAGPLGFGLFYPTVSFYPHLEGHLGEAPYC
ncbi:hypothetical protein ACS0TY_013606 [Phlomoides rotata]